MTKEEFLQEAALRLITAKKESTMCEIAEMAHDLTRNIYGTISQKRCYTDGKWWSDEIDTAPITILIEYIHEHYTSGSVRIGNLLKAEDINTMGDLLRFGKRGVRNIQNLGHKSMWIINDALLELYNIESW